MDCGRVWAERAPATKPLSRADRFRDLAVLLAYALQAAHTEARRVAWTTGNVVLEMAARIEMAEAHRGALDRCSDELVAFQLRYDAGDKDGAALALRAWIHKIGGDR